jgi:hypothetical protein
VKATPPTIPKTTKCAPIVLEVRVELLPEQQRDEPDQRKRSSEERSGDASDLPVGAT